MSSTATIVEQPTMTLAQKFKMQKAAALKKAMEEELEREKAKIDKKKAKAEKVRAAQLKKKEDARKKAESGIKMSDGAKEKDGSKPVQPKKRKATEEKTQVTKKAKVEEITDKPSTVEVKETQEEKRERLAIEKEVIISNMIMPLFLRPPGFFGPYIPRPAWMDAPEEEDGEFPLRELGKTWSWMYNERIHNRDHKAGYIPRAVRSETDE